MDGNRSTILLAQPLANRSSLHVTFVSRAAAQVLGYPFAVCYVMLGGGGAPCPEYAQSAPNILVTIRELCCL